MTDDTLDHLARDVRRIAIKGEPTARDTRTLADALGVALEALAETRRELAWARERIAIMTPAITDLRCDVEKLRAPLPTGQPIRVVEQPRDERALEPVLAPHPSSLARCAECGNDQCKQLGHRLCKFCQERGVLADRFEAHCRTLAAIDSLCVDAGADATKPTLDMVREVIAKLRAALREALDRWEGWNEQEYTGTKHHAPEAACIAELRRLL